MKQVSNGRNYTGQLLTNHKKVFQLEFYLRLCIPFFVAVSALLLKITFDFHMDSDPLWSIGVGEWIHANQTVPSVDVFSWTVAGEHWQSNSWLFCWLIYIADQTIGYLGVALLVFIPFLITARFLFLICREYHDQAFSIMVYLIGFSLLVYMYATPRAYIYTFAFIAVIMYLIRFKRDTNWIYIIPLIMLLWVNVQTSIRFGMAILLIEALVGSIFFKDKKLWPVVMLSFLATLINPYGISLWEISLTGYIAPGTRLVTEWRAPDFNNYGILSLYLLMFLVGLLGAFRLKDEIDKSIYDRDKIMILFWFLVSLLYSMNTGRALAYVLLLWAPCFSAFATKSTTENPKVNMIVAASVFLIFTSTLFYSLPHFSYKTDSKNGRPVNFIDYLQTNPILDDKVSHMIPADAVNYLTLNPSMLDGLFNSYIFGGYLLLNNIDTFIDARENVFTRHNVFEDYIDIVTMEVKPDIIIEKYDISTFLIESKKRLFFYLELHPEWEKKFEDDKAVIFTRIY